MLRILIVHDRDGGGGAERLNLDLAHALRQRGHQVRSLTTGSSSDYRARATEGRLRSLLCVVNPFAWRELRRALADFRPHVVHVGMFLQLLSPAVLLPLRHYPTIYQPHIYDFDCARGSRSTPKGQACDARPGWICARQCLSPQAWLASMAQLRLLERWRGAFDRVIPTSQAMAAALARAGWGKHPVIYPGTCGPAPDLLNSQKASQPRLVCAARLVAEKGVGLLLDAFAEVRRSYPLAVLQVAGSGPELPLLQMQAARLGISDSIEWCGQLTRTEMQKLFTHGWIQVVPSLWEEPFGLVACEAAALGLATVVTDVGGLPEIVVHEQTGLVVPKDQPLALAQALSGLIADEQRRQMLGHRARQRFLSHFRIETMAERLEQAYTELLSDKAVG